MSDLLAGLALCVAMPSDRRYKCSATSPLLLPFSFSLDFCRKPVYLIAFDAQVRKEYRASDARDAPWVAPQRVEVAFGDAGMEIVSGGRLCRGSGSHQGGLRRTAWHALSAQLKQLRCRPVISLPPSASIVAIVIGRAFARRGGSFAARLTRFLPNFTHARLIWSSFEQLT